MSQAARHSIPTLAVFLAAWTFAAATPGSAQVRATASASATVVDARAGWTTDAEVRRALFDRAADSVMMTEPDAARVVLTGADGLTIVLRPAEPGAGPAHTESPRRQPVRLRVDYAAN